jgi:hypothetical protein
LLCDQEEESIDHLLIGCVFAMQFWFFMLQRVGLAALAPQPSETSFDEWWRHASDSTNGPVKEGLNSLIVLGARTIWQHRNKCVFNGKSLHLASALSMAGEESLFWGLAGARGLAQLANQDPLAGQSMA